jgi:AN1-type zinc finger protein 5/6
MCLKIYYFIIIMIENMIIDNSNNNINNSNNNINNSNNNINNSNNNNINNSNNNINNLCSHEMCKRKLKLTDYSCKCNKIFCKFHRRPESHNCLYDYKNNIDKNKLINDLKCIASKLNY